MEYFEYSDIEIEYLKSRNPVFKTSNRADWYN